MKVIQETDNAVLRYNSETNSIELIWKKLHDESTYKFMFTKGLEYIKNHKVTGWLSDIRNEGVVSPANSKWLQDEIITEAVKHGLKKIAIVMEADVFKKFYTQNIEKAVENKKNNMIKYFDSVEAASEWLKITKE